MAFDIFNRDDRKQFNELAKTELAKARSIANEFVLDDNFWCTDDFNYLLMEVIPRMIESYGGSKKKKLGEQHEELLEIIADMSWVLREFFTKIDELRSSAYPYISTRQSELYRDKVRALLAPILRKKSAKLKPLAVSVFSFAHQSMEEVVQLLSKYYEHFNKMYTFTKKSNFEDVLSTVKSVDRLLKETKKPIVMRYDFVKKIRDVEEVIDSCWEQSLPFEERPTVIKWDERQKHNKMISLVRQDYNILVDNPWGRSLFSVLEPEAKAKGMSVSQYEFYLAHVKREEVETKQFKGDYYREVANNNLPEGVSYEQYLDNIDKELEAWGEQLRKEFSVDEH